MNGTKVFSGFHIWEIIRKNPTVCLKCCIYSWESSAYYHGYSLAELALAQWREYFYKKMADGKKKICTNKVSFEDIAGKYKKWLNSERKLTA